MSLELAQTHLTNVETCLLEVERLQERLVSRDPNTAQMSGLLTFIRNLKNDRQTLQNAVATYKDEHEDTSEAELLKLSRSLKECAINTTRSVLQWNILKRCRSFVALNQGFQGKTKEDRRREMAEKGVVSVEKQKMHRVLKEQGRVEVDVVENGREWIVIKSVQRNRLARHMTDCGWEWGEHKRGDTVDEEEWEDIPLVKAIAKVVAAAKRNRYEYQFPRVRVVLANFRRGEEEFDVLWEQIARTDESVEVVLEDMAGDFMSTPPPDMDTAIENLMGDDHEGLTPTLNLDHTILIDLISDLTHQRLEPQPWQVATTRGQIEEENATEGGVMAKTLYPLLQGRELVCTQEAVEHFHEVLRTVGTESERRRGQLILPFDDEARQLSTDEIRQAFQELSIYPLPADVQLPITVLPTPWTLDTITAAVASKTLPKVALAVAKHSGWKSSKLSIFMYGWASGNMTITSNREIRAQIRTLVETHRDGELEKGPGVWRVGVTRNLLAKGATPRVGEAQKQGDGS